MLHSILQWTLTINLKNCLDKRTHFNTQHIDRIRFVPSKQELDFIFHYRVTRKVKNNATITILNTLFEVPPKYIGEQIKVRYDPTQLDKAYIFDDDGKYIDTIYPIYKNR